MATFSSQRSQRGARSPLRQTFDNSEERNSSEDFVNVPSATSNMLSVPGGNDFRNAALDSPTLATGYFSQAVSRNNSYTNLSAPFRTMSYDSMPMAKARKVDSPRPQLATHQASSYGFSAATHAPDDNDAQLMDPTDNPTAFEFITALLLPLPFLLSSLNNPLATFEFHSAHQSNAELAEEVLEDAASMAIPFPSSLLSMIEACALTSGTLLLIGLIAQLRQDPSRSGGRSKNASSRRSFNISSWLSFQGVRRLLLRMVCVGLPYLATVEIGGPRTAIILLAAVTAGLISPQTKYGESKSTSTWRRAINTRRWSLSILAVCLFYDLVSCPEGVEYTSLFRGYLALVKSIFVIQPPFPTATAGPSKLNEVLSPSAALGSATPWDAPTTSPSTESSKAVSALVRTSEDAQLTFAAGAVLALITFGLTSMLTPQPPLQSSTVFLFAISVIAAAALYLFSHPPSMRASPNRTGLLAGLAVSTLFGIISDTRTFVTAAGLLGLGAYAYFAVIKDVGSKALRKKLHGPHTHTRSGSHTHGHTHGGGAHGPSKMTKILLRLTEGMPVVHGILKERESRRITYFMMINLLFMFVQTFYALLAGSLGLLSDSIHMFFDCVGLLAGLVAAVMSKKPPNSRFPYGYGKIETLSGLGNGIFLLLISVEIILESFERFVEGAELRHIGELLIVSIGGLLVNLVGLFFIGHAHHGHGHGHHHHGDEENENMAGIYLHILADTMGSVAVIISTILTFYTGWSGWDPLASCIIAILIILASVPLVVNSAQRLLLTLPADLEYKLRTALGGLSDLRGVIGYGVPRFWIDDGEEHAHHHDHIHGHEHGHDHHGHSHKGHHSIHVHDHDAKDHSHKHSHSHSNQHSHDHSHDHEHKHGHEHEDAQHHKSHDHADEQQCNHRHGPKLHGVVHVIASRSADLAEVRSRVVRFFKDKDMNVLVQMEREGDRRCWCGGMGGAHGRGLSTVMI